MFPSPSNTYDHPLYDFDCEENCPKWKGLLVSALQKVQYQVHPSLMAKEDALEYVESLILRLVSMLCASQPHSVQDVEDRVGRAFPHPIDKWAIVEAQTATEKGKKKSPLVLPVDKIHPLLQKEVLGYKIDYQVSLYIVAVLEYISADILKLSGNYVKNIRHAEINCQDIKVAMCVDKVLMDLFYQDEDVALSVEEEPIARTSLTYDEVVKDLIHEEKQYLRDLNMIIKVFRDPFSKLLPKNKDVDAIFSNILEIYDFSVNLLGLLEDTVEMTEENESPLLGSCFEEMAEAVEFDVYVRYAEEILRPEWREKLLNFLQQPDFCHQIQTAAHNFALAVKYVLPKLLLGPIYHCFQYFDYIKRLMKLTAKEDRESLEQAEGLLKSVQIDLERICSGTLPKRKPGEISLRMHSHMSRPLALQKMNELQKSIDGWEGKDIGQCCNEFIYDGVLFKIGSGKRYTERHVFLFDGLLILCKQNNRRTSVTGSLGEYRLKEKFFMRKTEAVDREDTDELKNALEIVPREQPRIILFAKTQEEKNNWMAVLIMLSTRSMLERTLDSILLNEEKKHPLWLPPPEMYRFAVEDDETNIVFEDRESVGGVPIIKGAALLKLVERLTYHMYADPMLLRTFLTTFRSFCQPQELLDLLIERFHIPEPPPQPLLVTEDSLEALERENVKNSNREDLKRFRKEYIQPVQFRVLNVLRHWVDHHFYDFERDHDLLVRLQNFLDSVKGKSMKKWVDSILKIVQRRKESTEEMREITFAYERSPPQLEWHITRAQDQFDLLTLHPIELARQLTLLEFDLYRAVKPSELVGSVWTKKDKDKSSPNLLKMIQHSTNFTMWLEKWVVDVENIDERVAVVSRILEIMIVLQELNNFNGVLEIVCAMNSASVYRLEHTFARISDKLMKALDDAKELNSDHYKKYQEKLRSINPPCVPFFGMYLTNILHTEEGNPDFLPNYPDGIINFSKRRKVADITGEIEQYQNQPYCLSLQPEIRQFLESLNPRENRNEKELNDYLYAKSLEIEPRNVKQPPKFPRKFLDSHLKSPGIKLRSAPRLLPLAFEPGLLRSSSRLTEDRDFHSPRMPTPPTPSSPSCMSPPHTATSDNSVFAHVLISPGGNTSPGLAPPSNSKLPPPLPPRRNRESSTGDISPKVKQAPEPPRLPPRDCSPPPLPPRPAPPGGGTLPRMHSSAHFQSRNLGPGDVTTLPRRNSVLDIPPNTPPPLLAPRRSSQSLATLNGPSTATVPPSIPPPPPPPIGHHQQGQHHGGYTPQLPPKTYKQNFHFTYDGSGVAPR